MPLKSQYFMFQKKNTLGNAMQSWFSCYNAGMSKNIGRRGWGRRRGWINVWIEVKYLDNLVTRREDQRGLNNRTGRDTRWLTREVNSSLFSRPFKLRLLTRSVSVIDRLTLRLARNCCSEEQNITNLEQN